MIVNLILPNYSVSPRDIDITEKSEASVSGSSRMALPSCRFGSSDP